MEARYLQTKLDGTLGRRCFLDSDDLKTTDVLKQAVLDSDVLILIQSKGVLERPWCLIEIFTALEHRIPIVCVSLVSGAFAYDHVAAGLYLEALDTELEARNPGASRLLIDQGFDLAEVAATLSCTLPSVISTAFNPSASQNILAASITDIVEEVLKATPVDVPVKEVRKARFETKRRRPSRVQHGSSAHHRLKTGQRRTTCPPEVPELPESMQMRPELLVSGC